MVDEIDEKNFKTISQIFGGVSPSVAEDMLKNSSTSEEVDELIEEYEEEIVEVKLSDAVSSELGPLKYLSGLTGYPMDRIINWLLLTIIFVFDPLAIALVVAANFAFDQIRPKTKENLYGETVIVEDKEEEFNLFRRLSSLCNILFKYCSLTLMASRGSRLSIC